MRSVFFFDAVIMRDRSFEKCLERCTFCVLVMYDSDAELHLIESDFSADIQCIEVMLECCIYLSIRELFVMSVAKQCYFQFN